MKNYDKKINQLIKLYSQAEQRLIRIISTKTIKGQVTDFYKSMLKEVKIELMKLQLQSTKLSKDIVSELYIEAYEKSLKTLQIDNIGEGFAKLHTDAINIITDNLVNNFAEVNNQVGRKIEDTIRDIGLTNAQLKFATGQTIKELQKELRENLINEGIGGITDKRGRVIPFTVYAELLGRSIVAETQNTSVMNVMKEHNRDLVKMTEHNTACPICVTYEGRVYSISGLDTRFPKLDTIPGFNKGYNNIHPRCRHRITPYIEKYNDVEKDIKNSNKHFETSKEKESSVNKYLEEQKEKARFRNDKKQHEKYREVLEEKAPKSLQSFRKIKYNDGNRWKELKQEYILLKNSTYIQNKIDYIYEGQENFIPNNSIVTKVKIIAGNGSEIELRSSNELSQKFGGEPDMWSKKVGKIESQKYVFDVHWNEYNGVQYWMKLKYRKEKK